jgi:hypothetical protein
MAGRSLSSSVGSWNANVSKPRGSSHAVQDVDDLALSGGLDAPDDEDHRELRGLELDLHPDERRADIAKARLIGLLRHLPVVSRFRHFSRGYLREEWPLPLPMSRRLGVPLC